MESVRQVWSIAVGLFATVTCVEVRRALALPASGPIEWIAPAACPVPTPRLAALVRASEKHPLWGKVTITQTPGAWHAHLALADTPATTNTLERSFDGGSCAEVTDAALLIISIVQREREQLAAPVTAGESPSPATSVSAPGVIPPARVTPPLAGPPTLPSSSLPPSTLPNNTPFEPPPSPAEAPQATPAPPPSPPAAPKPPVPTPAKTRGPAQPDTSTETSRPMTLGLGFSGTLWNGKFPAAGVVGAGDYHWDRLALRVQLGWVSSLSPLPTSESVRVLLTAREASLRLCWTLLAGLDACGGAALQQITVEGRGVDAPTRSKAWFPGVSAGLLGSQPREGLGIWGELGVNVRLKEIQLNVTPLGEVANIARPTIYAWIGPQWRWR